jgi:hypothetical protein
MPWAIKATALILMEVMDPCTEQAMAAMDTALPMDRAMADMATEAIASMAVLMPKIMLRGSISKIHTHRFRL